MVVAPVRDAREPPTRDADPVAPAADDPNAGPTGDCPIDDCTAGDPDPRCERISERPEPGEEELDPADPAVSAKATAGNATTAAPTPSAAASAPTRPTKLDDGLDDRLDDGLDEAVTPGRRAAWRAEATCLSRTQARPVSDFLSAQPDIRPPQLSGTSNHDFQNSLKLVRQCR